MTRKCQSQTNLWHREEETQNIDSHTTARTQLNKATISLPQPDDCKTILSKKRDITCEFNACFL